MRAQTMHPGPRHASTSSARSRARCAASTDIVQVDFRHPEESRRPKQQLVLAPNVHHELTSRRPVPIRQEQHRHAVALDYRTVAQVAERHDGATEANSIAAASSTVAPTGICPSTHSHTR